MRGAFAAPSGRGQYAAQGISLYSPASVIERIHTAIRIHPAATTRVAVSTSRTVGVRVVESMHV